MTRRAAALILALCLCLTVVPGGAAAAGNGPFTDVPSSHWASEAVTYVYENGLMNGVGEETFQPSGSLTRAMFVTILGRMAGVVEGDHPGTSFTDVPAGQWYSPYVAWAAQAGVAGGTGGGKFSPNSAVTREQMATMIARYTESAGLTLDEVSDPAPSFTDQGAVASWAREGVDLMRRTGILTGYEDGSFQPQRTANRAEAAAIFMRLDQQNWEQPPDDDMEEIAQEYANMMLCVEDMEEIQGQFCNADGYVDRKDVPALLDQVGQYAELLQDIGMISSYHQEESSVLLSFSDGVDFLFQPPMADSLSGGGQTAVFTPEGNLVNKLALWVNEAEAFLNLVTSEERFPYFEAEDCGWLLQNAMGSGTALHFGGGETTVEQLKNLGNYDYIIWEGHGGYSTTSHSCLVTDEYVNLLNYVKYHEDLESKRLCLTNGWGSPCYCVTPSFIETYVTDMDGAVVFLGACYSMKDNVLSTTFLQKGAAAVLGYTDEVYIPYEMITRSLFFMTFIQGDVTITEALDYAKSVAGENTKGGLEGELRGRVFEDRVLLPVDDADLSYLAGTYEGEYFPGQKPCGLRLTIPVKGDALVEFYPLPDGAELQAGSFTAQVSLTGTGAIRFDGAEWVDRPEGYFMMDLKGFLKGDTISGTSPVSFSVTRVSQEVPEDPVQPAVDYDTFLREKGYRNYLGNWWCTPTEYALLDIDQDGTQELILQGEDGTGFYNHLIFRWDAAQGTAVVVPMDGTDQGFASYGGLTYAPKYQAINLSYPRYSYYDGSVDYYVLQDGALRRSFSVGWTTPSTERLYFWADANGQQQIISQEQYEAYKPENQNIDFQPLP